MAEKAICALDPSEPAGKEVIRCLFKKPQVSIATAIYTARARCRAFYFTLFFDTLLSPF